MAGPGFSRGGGANPLWDGGPNIQFCQMFSKLHEIESIWTPGKGGPIFLYKTRISLYCGGGSGLTEAGTDPWFCSGGTNPLAGGANTNWFKPCGPPPRLIFRINYSGILYSGRPTQKLSWICHWSMELHDCSQWRIYIEIVLDPPLI